jgi:hypothetical protein
VDPETTAEQATADWLEARETHGEVSTEAATTLWAAQDAVTAWEQSESA